MTDLLFVDAGEHGDFVTVPAVVVQLAWVQSVLTGSMAPLGLSQRAARPTGPSSSIVDHLNKIFF